MHDGLSERGLGSQDGHLGVVGLRRPGQKKTRSEDFLWCLCTVRLLEQMCRALSTMVALVS